MVFRPSTPSALPHAFQTWSVAARWRRASCAEVECEHWANGWISPVDVSTTRGENQADYIRHESGRRFTETSPGPGQVVFRFHAGQTCFRSATHRVPYGTPELYVVRSGDYRKLARRGRVYDRADQWADDMNTTAERVAVARSRAGTAGP